MNGWRGYDGICSTRLRPVVLARYRAAAATNSSATEWPPPGTRAATPRLMVMQGAMTEGGWEIACHAQQCFNFMIKFIFLYPLGQCVHSKTESRRITLPRNTL